MDANQSIFLATLHNVTGAATRGHKPRSRVRVCARACERVCQRASRACVWVDPCVAWAWEANGAFL